MSARDKIAELLADQLRDATRERDEAREALARVEALAEEFESEVDWSAGRNNYGDNEAWESAARQLRAALRGDDA